jgi:hypothetical protein
MEKAGIVLTSIAASCVFWHVVVSLMIYDYLRRHGRPVRFIWLKAMTPKYASDYRKVTISETGKVGGLFYQWILSINLTLVSVIIAIVINRF